MLVVELLLFSVPMPKGSGSSVGKNIHLEFKRPWLESHFKYFLFPCVPLGTVGCTCFVILCGDHTHI